jgi:hypothetical protein
MTRPTSTIGSVLKEAALRLAWYVKAYGGIPNAEITKLILCASGIRCDDESIALVREAENIKAYLLEICSDKER